MEGFISRPHRHLLAEVGVWLFIIPLSAGLEYYCPANYTLYEKNASCFLIPPARKEIYWKASSYCMELNGSLATIKDSYTQEFLTTFASFSSNEKSNVGNLLENATTPLFWIGLSDRFQKRKFRWAKCDEGWLEATHYEAWVEEIDQQRIWKAKKRCAALHITHNATNISVGYWIVSRCTSEHFFICQTAARKNVSVNNITTPAYLQEQDTPQVKIRAASSPLRAILIVMVALIIISIVLAIWYRKRNRDSQQRRLIQASGMPGIGILHPTSSRPVSIFQHQPHFTPSERQFSNNSNCDIVNNSKFNRTVYSGQNIDVIEKDEYLEPTAAESNLNFVPPFCEITQKMDRFATQSITPIV